MANAHATHLGITAKSSSPSCTQLHPVLDLLGQIVVLTEFVGGIQFERTGHVIAVVVPLPGAQISTSILLEAGPNDCDYYDLDDVCICSASPATSLNTALGK